MATIPSRLQQSCEAAGNQLPLRRGRLEAEGQTDTGGQRHSARLIQTNVIEGYDTMCGRYTLRTPAAQMIEIFNVVDMPSLAPRYNIAPTQLVICIRAVAEDPKSREAVQMRWGLVPFWAKDTAIGNQMINARAETVAEKPAFRAAFSKRRCLIAADGFLEWQTLSTGKKQPWLMEMTDQQPFAMAGLWEYWTPKGESTLKPVVSCSIITTSANEDMSVLHDRMPVILPIEAWATWLSPTSNAAQCNALLKPLENGLLTKTCVSTKVNRPFPDTAECLQPVDPPEPLTKKPLSS